MASGLHSANEPRARIPIEVYPDSRIIPVGNGTYALYHSNNSKAEVLKDHRGRPLRRGQDQRDDGEFAEALRTEPRNKFFTAGTYAEPHVCVVFEPRQKMYSGKNSLYQQRAAPPKRTVSQTRRMLEGLAQRKAPVEPHLATTLKCMYRDARATSSVRCPFLAGGPGSVVRGDVSCRLDLSVQYQQRGVVITKKPKSACFATGFVFDRKTCYSL